MSGFLKTDNYAKRETARFAVSRDGTEYFWADAYNDCLVWLQSNVPYSWDHALNHEGWAIQDRQDEID